MPDQPPPEPDPYASGIPDEPPADQKDFTPLDLVPQVAEASVSTPGGCIRRIGMLLLVVVGGFVLLLVGVQPKDLPWADVAAIGLGVALIPVAAFLVWRVGCELRRRKSAAVNSVHIHDVEEDEPPSGA